MQDLKDWLDKALEQSPWVANLRRLRAGRGRLSGGRSLSLEEAQKLERQGNTAEAWDRVRLEGAVDLSRIRHSHFSGDILLTGFGDRPVGPPGLRLEPGISRCRLRDCIIGDACLSDVAFAEAMVVEDGAVLLNVGSAICDHPSLFGLGQALHPGSETGTRSIRLWDGMDLEYCRRYASLPPGGQEALGNWLMERFEGLRSAFAWIGAGAVVQSLPVLENCWIGPGARIRGALRLTNATLLSAPGEPVEVGAGAVVENALLQPGSAVRSGGQVFLGALLEYAEVEQQGIVTQSVIGPNTQVAKGEITASLVGPFVGFHHQALLIGALWPEGRGNIGYGANVGSNHTGKKPDQEIKPGEGNFFGLACSVKFPANYEDAPYSLFATGLTLLPQRLAFPFSLVNQPSLARADLPPALNEIFPGWMWWDNAYALFRNAYKYRDRNRARRHVLDEKLFGPELQGTVFAAARLLAPDVVRKVRRALAILRSPASHEEVYLEKHLAGLGRNFLREKQRAKAIQAYSDYLAFCLLCRFAGETPEADEEARAIGEQLGREQEPAAFARAHAGDLDGLMERVRDSLRRDERRGTRIFDDYGPFHSAEDKVLDALEKDLETLRQALRRRHGMA